MIVVVKCCTIIQRIVEYELLIGLKKFNIQIEQCVFNVIEIYIKSLNELNV